MSREEAFEAMKSGKKITHQYFSWDEFYEFKNNRIVAEDGVNHSQIFWEESGNNWRKDGWEIYKES